MYYDYNEAMKEDILEYIRENYTQEEITDNLLTDRDGWEEDLQDSLWVADSVTGNLSGSYTCNAWKAKEYVLDNMDLLNEAMDEFCTEERTIAENFLCEHWEWFDVSIRCYLLSSALSEALDELEEEAEQ